VAALQEAGHDVRATDLAPPVFERPGPGEADYFQADLTDAGDAFAVVRGAEAVVHAAAIPEPTRNPPHVVFHNNLMSTFNTLEAAIASAPRGSSTSPARPCPGSSSPSGPCCPSTCR
jgi:nucleoside-diphosphate-sugar epimerase